MAHEGDYYSTVEAVRNFTGVRPEDLPNLASVDALEDQIEEWLKDVKELIDEFCQRNFLAEEEGEGPEIPRGVHLAAQRAARNIISMARLSANAGQVNPDEFFRNQSQNADVVLTEAIKDDLRRVKQRIIDTTPTQQISLRVLPGRRSSEDESQRYPWTPV